MDEGRQELEGQPIDPKMLSISKDSFSASFKELNPQENSSLAQKEEEDEIGELRKNNLPILKSINELIESYHEEKAKPMLRGALMFHRALRKEGKALPTFTKEFVKEYDYQTLIRGAEIGEEAKLEEGRTTPEASGKARRTIVTRFRNLEPELSKIVEEELGSQPNWDPEHPEEDDIYSGIIDMYSLIRAGLSDPKNFEQ